ncbi:MAG: hypothetical protein GY769_10135, partial [bacterium]|nr:hypothetical protein [bacterium]
GDRDAVFDQCVMMNFIKGEHASKVDRDWLWNFSEPYYRPLLRDEPFLFTAEYCKEAITQMFGANMRKLNMPPEYLLLNRITFGLNSIMAKLDALRVITLFDDVVITKIDGIVVRAKGRGVEALG